MADQAQLRKPPHSVEAEQAVLGSVLLDNEAFDRCGDLVDAGDFYRHEHRLAWAAVAGLVNACKPADEVTVFQRLAAEGTAAEVGGLAYLHQLAQCVPSGRNARHYAAIVREQAQLRRLIGVADDVATAGFNPQGRTAAELIDDTMLRLAALQIGGNDDEPKCIGELLPGWIDALQDRAAGKTDAIALGLHDVDRLLDGGLRRGELMVVGARPSMGKSALTLGFLRNVGAVGPVLVCSLEDSAGMHLSRQVASVGRQNLALVRNPARAPKSLWDAVNDALDTLVKLPLYIDDRAGLSVSQVRRKGMFVKRKAGDLLLLVVDYLQLMEDDGENRADELAKMARGLKRVAKDLGCAVLLLSQLNRKADETNKPPRLDHLEGSGGIEAAADVIGLLYREGRHNPKVDQSQAQLELAKNKNGPTGTAHLHFDGATQRFESVAREEYEHA